jgi:hypothetical protein
MVSFVVDLDFIRNEPGTFLETQIQQYANFVDAKGLICVHLPPDLFSDIVC